MKADVYIELTATIPAGFSYWFRTRPLAWEDHRGIKEQLVAIVMGYADPVEL